MTDWKEERVRALVSAAEEAVERTRWVFLVLNLGSAIMVSAQLNLYWSWARRVKERIDPEKEPIALETITRLLWNDLYTGSMPLLGIKYNADDLIILGTAGMSILALWFFYAHRRENHCIGTLWMTYKEAQANNPDLASYIYAAVAHYFVFTTTTHNDKPFYRSRKERVTNQQNDESSVSSEKRTKLRWYVKALTHLPWVSALLCVLVFAACLFVQGMPLVQVKNPDLSLWSQILYYERIEGIVRIILGIFFTIVTAVCCFRAQIFDSDTAEMLREMNDVGGSSET